MPLRRSSHTAFARLRAALAPLLVAAVAPSANAQVRGPAPEYQGLNGSIALGAARWRLDDGAPPAHFAGGLTAGYRILLLDGARFKVSVTPQVGLTLTQFRGIKLGSREVGFSRVDKPAVQLAVRYRGVRPYLLVQHGDATIERYVNGELLNYWGSAPAWGFGVEFPRNNPCGAGPELRVVRMRGTLDQAEKREPGAAPAGGSIGATVVTLGWSGRFRGSRLLFACR